MNIEFFRDYCSKKKGVTEEFPFDSQTLVFKVGGKMFVLTDIDDFSSINLKCDPVRVPELIEEYPAVQPGYHMNKKYWITVLIDGSLPDKLILGWIDDSYSLVLGNLPERKRISIINSA